MWDTLYNDEGLGSKVEITVNLIIKPDRHFTIQPRVDLVLVHGIRMCNSGRHRYALYVSNQNAESKYNIAMQR